MSIGKPRASVSVVLPRSSVAVVVPAASISYILAKAEADVDTTGRYKYITEQAVVMLDGTRLALAKNVGHSVFVDTTTTIDFAKNPSDSISFSEQVSRVLIFIRNLTDSAPALDAASFLLAANKTDSVSTSDSRSLTPHKFLADGVSANDMFDITDGSTYTFAKSISDVTMLSETVSAIFQKVAGDQAGLSDSGVVVIQSYADISYFFEDYVGNRTLF